MKLLIVCLLFSHLCAASEKSNQIHLFFGDSFPSNKQKQYLFSPALTLQLKRPLGSDIFYEETSFFLQNDLKYSVYTRLERATEHSVIYIDQSLYLHDLATLLCSLKGAIVQTMNDNYCFLAHIETAQPYQKSGCARFLMACLEKIVQERKCTKITTDALYSAVGFYEKLGFVEDDDRDSSYERCFAMVKHLKGGGHENNTNNNSYYNEHTSS
jgi:GNAT superfamily N-acetyltransferase